MGFVRVLSNVAFVAPGCILTALFAALSFSDSFFLSFYQTTAAEYTSSLSKTVPVASMLAHTPRFEEAFGLMSGLFFLSVFFGVPARNRALPALAGGLGYFVVVFAAHRARTGLAPFDVPLLVPFREPMDYLIIIDGALGGLLLLVGILTLLGFANESAPKQKKK